MDDEGVPPLNEGSTEDGLAEHKTGMNSWTLGNQAISKGDIVLFTYFAYSTLFDVIFTKFPAIWTLPRHQNQT